MTAAATSVPASTAAPPASARFVALYRLFLRHQVTRTRLVALGALGIGAIVLAAVSRSGDPADLTRAGTRLIDGYGLSLLAPVASLVFASSVFGDLVDDRTLVYVWLTSVPRWQLAGAAALASLTVCGPMVIVPLVVASAVTGGGGELVLGTIVACGVAVTGYVGVFCAFGLRFRRALVWGIVYILLWEQFVARAAGSASKLALLSYSRSVLSAYTGIGLRLATHTVTVGIIVPIVVAALGVTYTSRRLRRHDVD